MFGNIKNPFGSTIYKGDIQSGNFGMILLLNNIIKLITIVAGLFAFFQFITAGFQFINAGGDSKAISQAWNKIWQAILGLVIVAGAFVLAAIFGYLIFGDPTIFLNPKLTGAGTP